MSGTKKKGEEGVKRKREEKEEADMVDIFTGLSKVPEKNLKKSIETIKNQRAQGKSTKKPMKKLLDSTCLHMEAEEASSDDEEEDDDYVMEEEDYDEAALMNSKEEKKARKQKGDDVTQAGYVYVDVENPDRVIDKEVAKFSDVFLFACMKALKEDYKKDMEYRATKPGADPRDVQDWEYLNYWLHTNIKDPLDRLIISLKGHEDRVAYFKQLLCAAALEFQEPDMSRTHICLLSGKELPPEEITQVALVDDPRLFKPLQPKSKQTYSSKPHLFTVDSRYRNITYSVFYLHTLIDHIGVRCLSWAEEQGLLSRSTAVELVTEFHHSDPDMFEKELRRFKVCKASVEAYRRGQQ